MNTLERAEIKEVTREIIQEDKIFFRTILRETVEEPAHESISAETESDRASLSRGEQIDAIIHCDFERYHNVFKALA